MIQKTIYITDAMDTWLSEQPRAFKLSTEVRKCFDTWMGTEDEAITNDNHTE